MTTPKQNLLIVSVVSALVASGPTVADDIADVFEWLEGQNPSQLSPSGGPTETWKTWTYRYYEESGNYLGITESGEVFFFKNSLKNRRRIGDLDGFLAEIREAERCISYNKDLTKPSSASATFRQTTEDGSEIVEREWLFDSKEEGAKYRTIYESGAVREDFYSAVSKIEGEMEYIESEYFEYVETQADGVVTSGKWEQFYTPPVNAGPANQVCDGRSWNVESVSVLAKVYESDDSDEPYEVTYETAECSYEVIDVNAVVETESGEFETLHYSETCVKADEDGDGWVVELWTMLENGWLNVKEVEYTADGEEETFRSELIEMEGF